MSKLNEAVGRSKTLDEGKALVAKLNDRLLLRIQEIFFFIISFISPAEITDKPFRTDRLTYTFSNETESYYKELNTGNTASKDLSNSN